VQGRSITYVLSPPGALLDPAGRPGSDGSRTGTNPTCRKPLPTPEANGSANAVRCCTDWSGLGRVGDGPSAVGEGRIRALRWVWISQEGWRGGGRLQAPRWRRGCPRSGNGPRPTCSARGVILALKVCLGSIRTSRCSMMKPSVRTKLSCQ
jgi:hypothetical protein